MRHRGRDGTLTPRELIVVGLGVLASASARAKPLFPPPPFSLSLSLSPSVSGPPAPAAHLAKDHGAVAPPPHLGQHAVQQLELAAGAEQRRELLLLLLLILKARGGEGKRMMGFPSRAVRDAAPSSSRSTGAALASLSQGKDHCSSAWNIKKNQRQEANGLFKIFFFLKTNQRKGGSRRSPRVCSPAAACPQAARPSCRPCAAASAHCPGPRSCCRQTPPGSWQPAACSSGQDRGHFFFLSFFFFFFNFCCTSGRKKGREKK